MLKLKMRGGFSLLAIGGATVPDLLLTLNLISEKVAQQ